jgi:eukaryotic-like serine/threonine-protein kinase
MNQKKSSNLSTQDLKYLSDQLDELLALSEADARSRIHELNARSPELAASLESLWVSVQDEKLEAQLDKTFTIADTPVTEDRYAPGNTLGSYTLTSHIADGGMSSVWLAERHDGQFNRAVAIKCLPSQINHPGFADRLRAEATLLAGLVHPAIAQLYDAGISHLGDPYLVLEYVSGKPITDYCDAEKLNLRERVKLLVQVCDAVSFMHQNLVVHCDLKPSNILVTAEGKVKVLDFGISQLNSVQPNVMGVEPGFRAFTPDYAAPEQIEGLSTSTRTDIFSIGALLCRLLTGSKPSSLDMRNLAQTGGARTMLTKPSDLFADKQTVLTADALSAICQGRRSTRKALEKLLRGDLDAIMLKAMSISPADRYTSAESLGADLRAFIEERPVAANDGGFQYRSRKFVNRNRGSVITGIVLGLAVLSTTTIALVQSYRFSKEVEKKTAVLSFVQDLLAEARPTRTDKKSITVVELLGKATTLSNQKFPNDPEMQFEVLRPIEAILKDLEDQLALKQLQGEMISLSEKSGRGKLEDLLKLKSDYALTVSVLGDNDTAIQLSEQLIQSVKTAGTRGDVAAYIFDNHSNILGNIGRGDEALDAARESFRQIESAGKNSTLERRSQSLQNLVRLLLRGHRVKEASELASKWFASDAVPNFNNPKDKIYYEMTQVNVYRQLGQYGRAQQVLKNTFPHAIQFFGADGLDVAELHFEDGLVQLELAQYEKAIKSFERALVLRQKLMPDNKVLLANTTAFALIAASLSHNESEIKSWQSAIAVFEQNTLAKNSIPLSVARLRVSQHQNDRPMIIEAIKQGRLASRKYSADRYTWTVAHWDLEEANILRVDGKNEDALKLVQKPIDLYEEIFPDNHSRLLRANFLRALILSSTQPKTQTVDKLGQLVAASKKSLGGVHPLTLAMEIELARVSGRNVRALEDEFLAKRGYLYRSQHAPFS